MVSQSHTASTRSRGSICTRCQVLVPQVLSSSFLHAHCSLLLRQVVVDTADTGMRLVRELNKARSGRVTFMPLDTLRSPDVSPQPPALHAAAGAVLAASGASGKLC